MICRALGEAIVNLRRRKGMAQDTLALESGIERAHMSGIERGKYNPGFATVYRLLPALGVSFTELVEEFERVLRRQKRKHNKVN